jgi:site-specific DNA recombinase
MLSLSSQKQRRIAIYIRVSTAEQQTEGYGLEAQRRLLVDYVKNTASMGNITKPEWIYSDTHTGSDLNRPGLGRLREAFKAKRFDAVLVFKIDRLSRSLQHLLTIFDEMEREDVSFISLHENLDFRGPMGKLIFQILGAMAQFERELIKDRTRMGRIASAQLGNFTGAHVPFGYRSVPNANGKGKKIELLTEEKEWVRKIYEWYVYDQLGSGQIANKLNELKVPRGKYARERIRIQKWSDDVVSGILTNPTYRGLFVANQTDDQGNMLSTDEWTVVKVPACVSEILFMQAQMLRKQNRGGYAEFTYLLSSKLWDMTLEKPRAFVGAKRTKGGFSYRRKQFDKDGIHYPVFEIPGKMIEEFVWAKIVSAIKDPEVFLKSYLKKNRIDKARVTELENTIAHLRSESSNLDLAMGRIESAFELGMYSPEKSQQKLEMRNDEKANLEKEIEKLEYELNQLSTVDIQLKQLQSVSEQLKGRIDKIDRKEQKVICQLLVAKVEMFREKQGRDWHTHAVVNLEFNLQKLYLSAIGDRTTKERPHADKYENEEKTRLDGADQGI